jgi:hypothetical protein
MTIFFLVAAPGGPVRERRQQKALLQSFVQEIRVVSREEIYPFFFVPAFRPLCGSVRPA